ncbi:helix-turn-helix transcriptional regulator [Thalassomonas viridans]|uniref:Helix-turn-helix transcriptional regulator n=1 Tax=Thalassomonas viridans TaxID=137584 RepID=A0AAF0C8A5_9GAMM|nr:helix-turn-helix transcriptional regulator [Thalassomonas viridans]WDE03674.1 helix-turn-helix transcriptional regulator [Thalassomonas viridans]
MVRDDRLENPSGDDLKYLRLWSGKSMQQMADLLGVHRHTVDNYEKGVSKIPLEYYFIWTKACGINWHSIIQQTKMLREAVEEQEIKRPRKKENHLEATNTENQCEPIQNIFKKPSRS